MDKEQELSKFEKRVVKRLTKEVGTGRSAGLHIESAEVTRFYGTDIPLPGRKRDLGFPNDLVLERPHTPLPDVVVEYVEETPDIQEE